MRDLLNYVSAFSKMQQLITSATSRAMTKTRTAVKNIAVTKLKLDVAISNQYLYVPVASDSADEYLLLDLGKIFVKNTFHVFEGEHLDSMEVP